MSLYKGRLGKLFAWDGTVAALAAQDCDENYDPVTFKVRISNVDHRLLSVNHTQTFTADNGVTVKSIDYLNGVATFNADVSVTIVRWTGSYIPAAKIVEVGNVYGWKLDTSLEILDGTILGSTAKVKIPGLLDWKGSVDAFWIEEAFSSLADDEPWYDKFNDGTIWYLKLFTHESPAEGFRGFVMLSGLSDSTPVGELVKETITFEGYKALEAL
jgi:hypothetical protein